MSGRLTSRARRFCSLLLALFSAALGRIAFAHGNGVGTGGCGGCHTGGKSPTVAITANPALFGPGQKTTLTVAISQTNGPSAGFYLYSSGVGSFSVVDTGTKLMGMGVTQTSPRAGSGGTTTFQVAWTAPSDLGGVLFSVWANSVNGDGRSSGDGEGVGYFSTAFGCTGTKYYRDADGDGDGSEASGYLVSCSLPQNYSATGTDCNDNDQHIYPAAVEVCDGKDNNCDGQVDEHLPIVEYCSDADGDGHGVSGKKTATGCTPPFGFGLCDEDCNDADRTVYPTALEACNNRDDNCNGVIDENARAICGVGWCARFAEGCQSACTPGQPRQEDCNAFDDDCDGVADNGSDLELCGKPGLACRDGECVADSDAGSMTSGGSIPCDGSSSTMTGVAGSSVVNPGSAGYSTMPSPVTSSASRPESGSCAVAPRLGHSVGRFGIFFASTLLLAAWWRKRARTA